MSHLSKAFPQTHPSEQQRRAAKSLDDAVHTQLSKATMGLSPMSLALAGMDWAMHLAASPGRQMLLAQQALALGSQLAQQACAAPVSAPADVAPPADLDPRFADAGWVQWPFNVYRDAFKATEAWWQDATQVDGVAHHHQHMVNFFSRQALDAMAPANWPGSNPEVLRLGQATMGQSWVKGYQSYARDVWAQQHRSTDANPEKLPPLPFKVGHDVAITPGQVVFRNHLIELIQYTPTTDQVRPEPILIIPSCIMKYYILDLSPANSMVRYLVNKGYTVFMISWRNPDASDRDLGMQDYLQMGVMEAMAAVKAQADAPRIHALGYCLGGTFLSIVAAALGRCQMSTPRRKKDDAPSRRQSDATCVAHLPELASVTLLAAQTDFSEPGELGVFIDDDQLHTLREAMARTGYLSGKQMAGSFQFLNSRDLIWSRNTRRYLLGQDEVGNDMMSWNADVTRLPERMHSEYLSSLFLNNALANGHYRVAGVGVALRDIRAPMLVVGTVRDHVSPWRSVFKIRLLTDTHLTFILAAGGHNAGIVSEPGHARRSYQIDSAEAGEGWIEPDAWAVSAPRVDGSWWDAMDQWLSERSGAPVPARQVSTKDSLCAAPGVNVMVRYAD